jgi:Right handed beta helix region
MYIRRLVFSFCVMMICIFLETAVANAQATRTWVSGVGDDVNPCSRTAPCKTFAGAISKTATNGEINCLDPGGFGAVTITKSITIDCEDTQGSILAAGTNGVIINITSAADAKKAVKLRGISINGAATGINGVRVIAANSVYVQSVVIDGFTQHGISVENADTKVQLVVNGSSIRSSMGSGINAAPTGTADVMVSGSLIAGNATGLLANARATVRISGNTITNNTTGLSAVGGGKIVSFKDNAIDGNGTNGAPTSTVTLQ